MFESITPYESISASGPLIHKIRKGLFLCRQISKTDSEKNSKVCCLVEGGGGNLNQKKRSYVNITFTYILWSGISGPLCCRPPLLSSSPPLPDSSCFCVLTKKPSSFSSSNKPHRPHHTFHPTQTLLSLLKDSLFILPPLFDLRSETSNASLKGALCASCRLWKSCCMCDPSECVCNSKTLVERHLFSAVVWVKPGNGCQQCDL